MEKRRNERHTCIRSYTVKEQGGLEEGARRALTVENTVRSGRSHETQKEGEVR